MASQCYSLYFTLYDKPMELPVNTLKTASTLLQKIMFLTGMLLACLTWTAQAAAPVAPDKLITNLFNEVTARIQQDEARIKADKHHLATIGEELLVPYVSFETMARQILGKNWRKITPDQQKRYSAAFKERVSSSIVAQYDPAKEYLLAITGTRANDSGDRAIVNSDVTEKNTAKKYQISYKLFMDAKSQRWQVYDMAVDGISVLQSFKSASAEDFKRNGIEYMISQLEKAPEPASTVQAKH